MAGFHLIISSEYMNFKFTINVAMNYMSYDTSMEHVHDERELYLELLTKFLAEF